MGFPFNQLISIVTEKFLSNCADGMHCGIQTCTRVIKGIFERIYAGRYWNFGKLYATKTIYFRSFVYDIRTSTVGEWLLKIDKGTVDIDDSIPGLFCNKKKMIVNIMFTLIGIIRQETKINRLTRLIAYLYYTILISRCISKINEIEDDYDILKQKIKQYDSDRKQLMGIIKWLFPKQYIPYTGKFPLEIICL